MPFRLCSPLAANPRMEDLFKRALFCRVAKYYCAKFVSIQVSGIRENSFAKFATNFFFNFRVKIGKLVRSLIRVEKSGSRNDFTQTFAEASLACRNSAGDPDDSHSSED